MNIQDEVQKIHAQYGMTEKANYKIQLLTEQYAKEYHEQQLKILNILVSNNEVSVCDAPECLVKSDKKYDSWYCEGCNYNPKQNVRQQSNLLIAFRNFLNRKYRCTISLQSIKEFTEGNE